MNDRDKPLADPLSTLPLDGSLIPSLFPHHTPHHTNMNI